jgi:transposase
MAGQRRSYSRQVKAEAIRRVLEADQSPAEVARELDVHPGAVRAWVHRWRHDYRDPDQPAPAQAARVSELEDENRALRAENEFLKEAQAFFAARAGSPTDAR